MLKVVGTAVVLSVFLNLSIREIFGELGTATAISVGILSGLFSVWFWRDSI